MTRPHGAELRLWMRYGGWMPSVWIRNQCVPFLLFTDGKQMVPLQKNNVLGGHTNPVMGPNNAFCGIQRSYVCMAPQSHSNNYLQYQDNPSGTACLWLPWHVSCTQIPHNSSEWCRACVMTSAVVPHYLLWTTDEWKIVVSCGPYCQSSEGDLPGRAWSFGCHSHKLNAQKV